MNRPASEPPVIRLSLGDDHLQVWVEQGSSIHLKAIVPAKQAGGTVLAAAGLGDPVELSDVEVAQLASFLLAYLKQQSK